MTTQSIQEIAVERAIAFLRSAGAQFKIVLGETVVADTLPAAPTKRSYTKTGASYKQYYQPVLESLSQPETFYAEIHVPQGVDLEGVRGSLASALVAKFGKGNCITKVEKEKRIIEILRAA